MTFWAVWYHINKVYHQGERQCKTRLISFIKAFYTENIQLEVVIEVGVQQNGCAWTPPRISVVKACTYPNTFVVDATTAEARACLQKVVVVEDLGFRNLVVERDSLTVIKKIQTFEEDKSIIAMIIKEIKEQARRKGNDEIHRGSRLKRHLHERNWQLKKIEGPCQK
ncbi:hypothetical protein Gohar_013599, partial [Gossypium harknessii]|nr:hypothetical protein [Gossypium harknessii]